MFNGKILVAQGGGPTAVINQSLVGVILETRRYSPATKVYGSMHGVNGIINQNFLDLTQETLEDLENVAATPCSALGSTRDKPDINYCKEIFKVLKAHEIGTFFYIGGNDSSDSLRIISDEAKAQAYPLTCIHIPKTIDNDLMINDHTPGFPSAAKFVARAFAGINQDNRALPGIYLGVVMGRHAGFLTAASSLARQFDDDGPHLIYLPEKEFVVSNFVRDVSYNYHKFGRCVIAVSEGISDTTGTPITSQLSPKTERDAHGNIQLSGTGALADLLTSFIKKETNINRVRGDTFGYLQRSFLGCVSEIDKTEAREVGIKAVHFAKLGNQTGSVTIHRTGVYNINYRLSSLEDIAGKTKVMPNNFMTNSGTDVTQKFQNYLQPMLGDSQLETFRLKGPKVASLQLKN